MADILVKLHEMYARNNMELLEVNKRLAGRTHALEQLVKDWRDLVTVKLAVPELSWQELASDLRARTNALLEQESK